MKIYVDNERKCHKSNPDNAYREVEIPEWNGKCDTFIEGYCYDDSKGYVQVYPWKPLKELDNAQQEYERRLLAEYAEALRTVGVNV